MGHYDNEALNTQAGVKGYNSNKFESGRAVTLALGRSDSELYQWGYSIAADVDGKRAAWVDERSFWTFVKRRHEHKKLIQNIKRLRNDG